MEKRMRMLSSAYRCQKVICMTLRVAIPLSLILGILLGVLITMDTGNPISPALPLVYRCCHEVDSGNVADQESDIRNDVPIANSTHADTTAFKTKKNHTTDPFLLGLPLIKPFGEKVMTTNLTELKIYIYPLPKGFNKNLADCAVRNARSGMCFDITNKGKGSLLKTDFVHGYSVYNTHQFSLEVLFHQRLLQSEYVTWDPEEADLFYVPYYVCMRCFCPAQDGEAMNTEFWQVMLHNYTYLGQGRPHFTALGKVEQEMASKTCPFLQGANSHFMKYLLIEQTAKLSSRRFFGRLGKESEVLVVPYPSYIHFDRPLAVIGDRQQALVDLHDNSDNADQPTAGHHSNRTMLALMVGSLKKLPLRLKLVEQLRNSSVGHAYVIMPSECWLSINNVPMKIVKLMYKSVFCIQPPGDTATRKSFFDSILCGCIPVIFSSKVVYPFMDILDYSTFTILIPEEEILVKNRSIISILKGISKERIESMQDTLRNIAVHFQYGSYRHGQDAFTLSLKRLVHKFYLGKYINDDNEESEGMNKSKLPER